MTGQRPRLRIGDRIPDFSAVDANDQTVTSGSLLASGPLVLYFYPKNETKVCTAQACAFRDDHEAFIKAGATVVGVSPDTAESHRQFSRHHNLPFRLLADPDGALFTLFGVSDTLGIIPGRETFVFDQSGALRHQYRSQLFGRKHVVEALASVQRLATAPGH